MVKHCKYGHSEEAYINPRGDAECRECRRVRRREHNKTSNRYKEYQLEYQGTYKKEHPTNNDSYFFGGNRETVIQRDNEKCISCDMSRHEHKIKYSRDITVDHIDGNGRNKTKLEKNNSLENLQTLCLPCHTRKDKARLTKEVVYG